MNQAVSSTAVNDAQLKVLRWIAEGCPDGVMPDGYAHRISARSLETHGLVKISGRGPNWRAELTPAGRSFLENPKLRAGGSGSTPIPRKLLPLPDDNIRLNAVAQRFLDQTDQHEVSRALLPRCGRIVHALVAEARQRGHRITNVRASVKHWSPSQEGHLIVRIRDSEHRLRLTERGVPTRCVWEAEQQRFEHLPEDNHYRVVHSGWYDKDATGELRLGTCGASPQWHDGKVRRVEERLADVLPYLEKRTEEATARRQEHLRAYEQRKLDWDQKVEQAKERFVEAHRADQLRSQIEARLEAAAATHYLAELEAAHGNNPASAEWIDWIRAYITRLDPLAAPPELPEVARITETDLAPFLRGARPSPWD